MVVGLKDEAATEALGARIARGLRAGDAILLSGELGAGKTVLARAILRARGVTEYVPSPTFTLVQAYETPGLTLYHFDLYRIERTSELNELGLDEAYEDGAILVEWPERAPRVFPDDALKVNLHVTGEHAREAQISGPEHWRDMLADAR